MGSKFSLTPWLLSLVSRGVDYIDWPHTKIHIDCHLFMPKAHKLFSREHSKEARQSNRFFHKPLCQSRKITPIHDSFFLDLLLRNFLLC